MTILSLSLLFLLLGLGEKSFAATDVSVVTPDIGVKLRETPEDETGTVSLLKQGTKVHIMERLGDWAKVSVNNDVGYIRLDYLTALTTDLAATYAHYDSILNTYSPDGDYYFLLYDFTQDGVEELYIAVFNDTVQHKMYSGQQVLLDESLGIYNGLTIYSDEYNYYIVSKSVANRHETMTDQGLKTDFEYDELSANASYIEEYVIHPGNLHLARTSISEHWYELIDYKLAGQPYIIDPPIEMTTYIKDGNDISFDEYNDFKNLYEQAPNSTIIAYDDISSVMENEEYTSNLNETKNHLAQLYETYTTTPNILPYSEEQLAEIEQYIYLHIAGAGNIYDENNERNDLNVVSNFVSSYAAIFSEEMRNEFAQRTTLIDGEQHIILNKAKVDQWFYTFYGIRLDEEKVAQQIEASSLNDGIIYWEAQDDTYICYCDGMGSPPITPKVLNVTALNDDFYAIEYGEYSDAGSLLSASTSTGVIVVKKVTTLENDVHYPYIQTYRSLHDIDEAELNTYAASLHIVSDAVAAEKTSAVAEQSVVAEHDEQTKPRNYTSWIVAIIAAFVIVLATLLIKKRKK